MTVVFVSSLAVLNTLKGEGIRNDDGFVDVPAAKAAQLIAGKNAYSMDHPRAFPRMGYVDPGASPYPPPAPSPPAPAPQQQPVSPAPEPEV